jgi:hypothetical protein
MHKQWSTKHYTDNRRTYRKTNDFTSIEPSILVFWGTLYMQSFYTDQWIYFDSTEYSSYLRYIVHAIILPWPMNLFRFNRVF